jgi:hypothetical protein
MVFDDRPMVSFGTRKIDKGVLTFLEFFYINTLGILLVI